MSPSACYTVPAALLALAVLASVASSLSDFGFGGGSDGFGNGNSLSRSELQKWGNLQEKRQLMGHDDGFGIWSPSRNKFINWQAVLGGASKRSFGGPGRTFGSVGRPNTAGLQNWRNTFLKRDVKRSAADDDYKPQQ